MHNPATSLIPQWIKQNGDQLVSFLTSKLGCRQTAADLAQDTYLKLYDVVPCQNIDNLGAFAYRVAANLAIDHHRKQAVRARYEGNDEDAESVAAPGATPEQALSQAQRLSLLQVALDELPADCRAAFLANRLDGCSHAEIAQRLGVSESMVAKHIARALRHCRQRLDG